LPVAVVAPKFFAKEIELGVISQAVGAFNHILSDVSVVVNQFESLTAFSAGMERLSSFFHEMQRVDDNRDEAEGLLGGNLSKKNETAPVLVTNATIGLATAHVQQHAQLSEPNKIKMKYLDRQDPYILCLEEVDVCTPDRKRILVHDLNLQLRPSDNLLIVGNSGAGKSSLLRAISGLWTTGKGTVSRPVDEDVYFLPQRPYCTLGSLKDQLLYPSLDRTIQEEQEHGIEHDNKIAASNRIVPRAHWLNQSLSDDDLLGVLRQVDLFDVASRAGDGDPIVGLHTTLDWSRILSLGEQQRLAFGRLLVNRPRLVILDEASSALDLESEARMYQLLQAIADENRLTYISVGHRPSLLAFHNKKLRLMGEAGFEVSDVEVTSELRQN